MTLRALVFDTETTGLTLHATAPMERQPKIIEFAGLLVDLAPPHDAEPTGFLLDPGEPVTEEITKITGINNEMLEGQFRFADRYEDLRRLFASADVLIAHNAPFDVTMMRLELQRLEKEQEFAWPALTVCTVQEFAERYGGRVRMKDLYEDVLGRPLDQTHRALDDVQALVEICEATGLFENISASLTRKEEP